MRTDVLRRSALRVNQHRDRPLYLLTLTTGDLDAIAGTKRIGRDAKGQFLGANKVEPPRWC